MRNTEKCKKRKKITCTLINQEKELLTFLYIYAQSDTVEILSMVCFRFCFPHFIIDS